MAHQLNETRTLIALQANPAKAPRLLEKVGELES